MLKTQVVRSINVPISSRRSTTGFFSLGRTHSSKEDVQTTSRLELASPLLLILGSQNQGRYRDRLQLRI